MGCWRLAGGLSRKAGKVNRVGSLAGQYLESTLRSRVVGCWRLAGGLSRKAGRPRNSPCVVPRRRTAGSGRSAAPPAPRRAPMATDRPRPRNSPCVVPRRRTAGSGRSAAPPAPRRAPMATSAGGFPLTSWAAVQASTSTSGTPGRSRRAQPAADNVSAGGFPLTSWAAVQASTSTSGTPGRSRRAQPAARCAQAACRRRFGPAASGVRKRRLLPGLGSPDRPALIGARRQLAAGDSVQLRRECENVAYCPGSDLRIAPSSARALCGLRTHAQQTLLSRRVARALAVGPRGQARGAAHVRCADCARTHNRRCCRDASRALWQLDREDNVHGKKDFWWILAQLSDAAGSPACQKSLLYVIGGE